MRYPWRHSWWACLMLFVAATVGCGVEVVREASVDAEPRYARSMGEAAAEKAEAPAEGAYTGAGPQRPPNLGALQRKIIYNATVELVVESFEQTPAEIEQLVRKHGGYVARSNISGAASTPRSGEWTVRIPVDQYDAFMAAVRGLGEVRRIVSDSREVTEEYYDIEARLRNKKTEEKRLIKLLEDATGKLSEILNVEREVSRVRGEIEQLEGRLRMLDDLTAMTTITIRVEEIKGYQPPEAPSYGTEVRRAWEQSINAMLLTGRRLSIAAVAAAPWVVLLAIVFSPLLLWLRWAWRRTRRLAQTAQSAQ